MLVCTYLPIVVYALLIGVVRLHSFIDIVFQIPSLQESIFLPMKNRIWLTTPSVDHLFLLWSREVVWALLFSSNDSSHRFSPAWGRSRPLNRPVTAAVLVTHLVSLSLHTSIITSQKLMYITEVLSSCISEMSHGRPWMLLSSEVSWV